MIFVNALKTMKAANEALKLRSHGTKVLLGYLGIPRGVPKKVGTGDQRSLHRQRFGATPQVSIRKMVECY